MTAIEASARYGIYWASAWIAVTFLASAYWFRNFIPDELVALTFMFSALFVMFGILALVA